METFLFVSTNLAVLLIAVSSHLRLLRLERMAHPKVDLYPAIRDEVAAQLAHSPVVTSSDPAVLIEAIRADAEVAKEMFKAMREPAGRGSRRFEP